MFYLKKFKKFFSQFIAKFFSIITSEFDWTTKSTNPPFKNSSSNSGSFFVWQGANFSIFCKSISHT